MGYGRIHSPEDPLRIDPSLDAPSTARFLAQLFPSVYEVYCAEFDATPLSEDPGADVPEDWFIQLVRTRRALNSVAGQVGATTQQLLARAAMTGRRLLSKEIFLGTSVFRVFHHIC